MKKPILAIFTFLIFLFCANAQTTSNFTKSWAEVTQLERQSQPKSALEKVAEIEKQAKQQNNRPQQIKALLYRSRLQGQITQDAHLLSLDEIQQFKESSTDAVEQAFLSSVLAQIYNDYFNQNRWQIGQRTVLRGYIPEDMKNLDYIVFMGGDHHLLDYTSSNKNGKTLMVIKDSYANAFIPWVSPNYERIIIIDPRLFGGSVSEYLEDIEDVDLLFMTSAFTPSLPAYVERVAEIK